jgi:hypothetical protein
VDSYTRVVTISPPRIPTYAPKEKHQICTYFLRVGRFRKNANINLIFERWKALRDCEEQNDDNDDILSGQNYEFLNYSG